MINFIDEQKTSFGLKSTVNPVLGSLLEALGSFFIVFVYYMVVIEKNTLPFAAGAAMGSVYFLPTIYLLPMTGAGVHIFRPFVF